nr:hypothetical protein [Tanacetum cinerariifolium]
MSTQQDIYASGSENFPPMLNKENYVSWSSRLLRRMIPEPGDPNRKVPVNETFHVQTDDELTDKELKHIKADDQAIQTILLSLLEDIYAAVDSCETDQKIWLCVQQMMKGSDIGIQEKKAKLFNEWERFTSTNGESIESYYHRFLKLMNDLKRNKHFLKKIANYTQLYDFLKYNQNEVDDLKAKRLARTQDPLALMVIQNAVQNPRIQNVGNQNGLIGVLWNTNQNSTRNGNLVAARAKGNATGHNGNQIRCYNYRGVDHFARNCTVRPMRRDAAYLQTQLLIAQKEEAGIQLQAKEFDLMAAAVDLDEIEEVNASYILMANLQQASTSGTQTDKAPIYDSDGSTEKLENENVELKFQVSDQKDIACGTSANTKFRKQSILGKPPKVGETHALSKPVTSNSITTPQGSKVMKNVKVIAPRMFRINPFKSSREEKHVPNKVRASVRTNPITVSEPPVITKKDMNSNLNGLSSTGLDNTKTRRPQPRCNTKNDKVPSASKSSRSKNKEVNIEEHHRNLLLSKKNKHISSGKSTDNACVSDTQNQLFQKVKNANVELEFQVFNYA